MQLCMRVNLNILQMFLFIRLKKHNRFQGQQLCSGLLCRPSAINGLLLQDAIISASAAMLTDVLDYGYWDTSISYPAAQLLDNVLGAMDVEEGDISENAKEE